MKVTQSHLEHKISRINLLLGRPSSAYTATGAASYTANVGNFHMHRNSPGDGKTRYELYEMLNEDGGVNVVSNRCFVGASAFNDFLTGVLFGLEAKAEQ